MSKKTCIILIFIGLLLNVIGIDFDLPFVSGTAISLPVGMIGGIVLIIIGSVGLYKHTNSNHFIKTIVFVGIYCGLNLLTVFLGSTLTTAEVLNYFESLNENNIVLEELVEQFKEFSGKINLLLGISILPLIASLFYSIELSIGLSEIAVNSELSSTLKTKGKKSAIFICIGSVVIILGVLLIMQNASDILEFAVAQMNNNSAYQLEIGTILGIVFFVILILPVSLVLLTIGFVAEVKYLIAVGKLINDVDQPINNEPIDEVVNNDLNSDEFSLNNEEDSESY